RIADRLLAAGHCITGYNRTQAKAQWLVDKGLKWAESPREVAAAAEITFSMVTNSQALEDIAYGPPGVIAGLTAGKLWVDMSTVSPSVNRSLVARAREKGADMLDCPVSGSVITLEQGKLTMMVGGRKESFERVKPILLEIGPKATHVGDNGLALVMK